MRGAVCAPREKAREPLCRFLFRVLFVRFEKIEMLLFADQIVPDRYA